MATISEMSNLKNFFKRPEMELSEVMMKIQTQSGQILKTFEVFAAVNNY